MNADRRCTFAILVAIGAKPRQLGVFIWSEALIVLFAARRSERPSGLSSRSFW
jgi:hypothetical protein